MMSLVAVPASFMIGMATSVIVGFVVGVVVSAPFGWNVNFLVEIAVGVAMLAGFFVGAIGTIIAMTGDAYG